jgi:hypothetical protein
VRLVQASQFDMQFEDLEALFGLHRVYALVDVLHDHVLDVLFLQLQEAINVGKLLIPIA